MLENVRSFLAEKGLPIFDPELDGERHRVPEHSHLSYLAERFYIGSTEAISLFVYDFKTGTPHNFKSHSITDPDLLSELDKLSEAQSKKAKKLMQEAQAQAALECQAYWETCLPPSPKQTPIYCERKGIKPLGSVRVDPECLDVLVVPLYDDKGTLWSIQKIYPDGSKAFWPGSRVRGVFFSIGDIYSGDVFLTEGYATAVTIHQASGAAVIVTLSASNLSEVARLLAGKLTSPRVAADNDEATALEIGYNPGLSAGLEASKALSCPLSYPTPALGTAEASPKTRASKDFSDFNDLARISNLQTAKEQLMTDRRNDPDFIPSKDNGFYIIERLRGGGTRYLPQHEDLLKFFRQTHTHKITKDGRLFIYNNTENFYERTDSVDLETFAYDHFNPKPTTKTVADFKKYAQIECPVPSDFFSQGTDGRLNFLNGVLDLAEGVLHPHDPEKWGFTANLGYHYDPDATCPRFDQFMKDVTSGDKDREALLLEFMGYALSNDECWAHKAMILVGEGANGKSTLLQILKMLAGKGSWTELDPDSIKNQFALASLEHALFAISEEMPKRVDSKFFDVLKRLSSGGDLLVERKFENPYIVKNKAKFLLACNQLPHNADNSDGFFRRLIVVPFEATFSVEAGNLDRHLMERLLGERAGIFNRLRRSYLDLKKRGHFQLPEAVREAIAEYKEGLDHVHEFVEEFVEFDKSKFNGQAEHVPWVVERSGTHAIVTGKLYVEYLKWAKTVGSSTYSKDEFSKRLKRALKQSAVTATTFRLDGVLHRGYLNASCRKKAEF